ncbi:3'(2'),5'-bisphosphate nucleotidase CysQ [Ramlibacter solisilvae]|uniref:3'(2'),5'-bisphosphate nucleotidase CysQ n=1 Tax=Ramlibacter tataouinensis TaxID=94132 RepID=A0A127JVD9_9BURK|nr:3'(2'),5'-bisphosphate nucleotidase CysQ [Ramlibacter tataouinensis]AMO23853.1 hypothetical protein UC35_14450 [Ramlibacter tataouinensis]
MLIRRDQLESLCEIAQAAGREIMAVYRTDFASWHKQDQSPLTEGDLRADKVIRAGLESLFPGVFILSEESTSAGSGARDVFFLVDPLDGTREFLRRNDEFTVNIALIAQGRPMAGVVLAPALGELFFAAQGLGAWKRQGDVQTPLRARRSEGPLRVIGSRSHDDGVLDGWLERLQCAHTYTAAGSSLKFCRIAEGAADIYPRLGPTNQWDTAAGQAVLEQAGGAVLAAQGGDLRYGLDRALLNPHFVALADRLTKFPPLQGAAT